MVFVELLVVVIYVVYEVGDLQGKCVFIFGVGFIGCLIVSVVKMLGVVEVVCVDISICFFLLVWQMGVDMLVNLQYDFFDGWKVEKGYFDISFEVFGYFFLILMCLEVIWVKGVMVQVGMGGVVFNFLMMMVISKEIFLKGFFCFIIEFNIVVFWFVNCVINLLLLLSVEYLFIDLEVVLIFVGDKIQVVKVQFVF